jgi:hypothetical protein
MVVIGAVACMLGACAVLAWWDVARRLLAYLRARDEAAHRSAVEADVAALRELTAEHTAAIARLGARSIR